MIVKRPGMASGSMVETPRSSYTCCIMTRYYIYNTGIALTKVSVLAFYRRIFSTKRPLKRALFFVGAFTIAWWFSSTMASILQYVPIQAYWDPKNKAPCEKKYAFYLGQAITQHYTRLRAVDFAIALSSLEAQAETYSKDSSCGRFSCSVICRLTSVTARTQS